MSFSPQDTVIPVLAKTLFSGLSISSDFSEVIRYSSDSIFTRKSNYVYDGALKNIDHAIVDNFNNVATSNIVDLKSDNKFMDHIKSGEYNSCCNFWPFDWHNDLRKLNISSLNVDYYLYSMLNSKIHQFDIIRTYGNKLVRESMDRRAALFGTRFSLPVPTAYYSLREDLDDFVVTAPTSAGGSGVFLIRSLIDFIDAISHIKTPVMRVEKYFNAVSLTQLGIVFENMTITYPVQTQYIKLKNGNLTYAGASSDLNHFPNIDINHRATEITAAVGEAIAKLGYLGAFGCDLIFIPATNDIFLMELNPRFVGETFFFSELAAAATHLGDMHERILIEPHFLNACAHLIRTCPSNIAKITERHINIPVENSTKEGYTTLLPLYFYSRNSDQEIIRQNYRLNHKICILFKGCIADDLIVPTRFVAQVEDMWTRTQVGRLTP